MNVQHYLSGMRGALLALALLGLAACSGGGDSSSSAPAPSIISGTAAKGAAIANAAILIKGANGQSVSATAGANGKFTADVSALTFPAMIRAQSAGSPTLYAWSLASGTANVTPLTTIALVTASPLTDALDIVFANWPADAAAVTSAAMLAAQAIVNANLQAQMTAATVPYQTYDFLKAVFDANGAGIDAVLDGLDFVFDLANGTFSLFLNGTNTAVAFDPNISTAGITIGGGGGGGGGSGSATINFTDSTPASGNGSMTVTNVTSALDGALTRVTVTGTVGGLVAEVKVYFSTATGNITNITYSWGATVTDNIVFSPTPVPAFEAVNDTGTKTINIDTDLNDADGFIVTTPTKLSHISATIQYP